MEAQFLQNTQDPSFIFNPVEWIKKNIFGGEEVTPQTIASGSSVATTLNTTTVIGYLLIAGVTVYIARKVIKK